MKASLPTKKNRVCAVVFLYFHGFIFFPFPLNDGIMALYIARFGNGGKGLKGNRIQGTLRSYLRWPLLLFTTAACHEHSYLYDEHKSLWL